MKRFASFVMQGYVQSVMVTTLLAMLSLIFPLIGIPCTAIVGLISLRKGGVAGVLNACAAALICGLLLLQMLGMPQLALVFLLLQWLPVGLLAMLLRNSRSLVLTTHAGLGFGLLAVLVQYIGFGNPAEFWREQLQPMAQRLAEAGLFAQANSAEAIEQLSGVMSGVVAAGFMLQLLLSLYLARWWQALLYNPGGFSAEFHQLRVHRVVGILGVCVTAIWLIPGWVVPSAVSCIGIVILSVFLLQGLAVAHGVFAGVKYPRRWLIATYAMLLLFMQQMVMVLITVGLLDVWLDFRARYRTGADG